MAQTDKQLKNLKPYKPGQCGNPAGRKKGSKNISTILKMFLDQTADFTDPMTGKKVKDTFRNQIGIQLLSQAARGDRKAIKDVLDRIEGTAIQRQEIDFDAKIIVKPPRVKPKKKNPKNKRAN